jgi:hypothetical protein
LGAGTFGELGGETPAPRDPGRAVLAEAEKRGGIMGNIISGSYIGE